MSNTTPPPHASSSYAYNYGGRWQGISVEKVIKSFLQFLEMDPEKNEVNYDTYGRFHPCYESVADAVYGAKHDANARRNDTKWLDTLWKQNRRKIRTIVLRKALEQNLITREQLEKCRRKALERAASNYDFIDTLPDHAVDSKNRNRAVRQRDTSSKAASAAATKQNGSLQTEAKNSNAVSQFTQQDAPLPRSVGPSTSSLCVPVPVERCVKLAIFTSNSLKLGQLLSPFEMPNGTLLVLDNDEVFVFQKAHVNLNLQLALANGGANGPQARVAQPSSSSAGASVAQTESQPAPQPVQQTTTRNKRKSKAPQCSTRSKRVHESTEAKDAAGEERTEVGCNEPDTRSSSNYSNVTGSPIFSHVNGSPIVSIDDERLISACVRHVRSARVSSVDEDAPSSGVWFDEADVKPLLVAD